MTTNPAPVTASAATYKVVVNPEEQYSVWFVDRENPVGWSDAGFVGTRDECLAHIEAVWTDMTPVSLRRKVGDDGV